MKASFDSLAIGQAVDGYRGEIGTVVHDQRVRSSGLSA
jgi:hypothetical protein